MSRSISQDVMGSFYSPDTKGLVDAESDEEFDEVLLSLSPIWDKCEAQKDTTRRVL